jgi:hypothetical protein
MSDQHVHVNDIGVAIRLTVTENGSAVDLSTAGNIFIKLQGPDGRVQTKNASFVIDGLNGQIQYVTQSGDLDQPGLWRRQALIQNLGGWTGHTSEGKPFEVRQVVG